MFVSISFPGGVDGPFDPPCNGSCWDLRPVLWLFPSQREGLSAKEVFYIVLYGGLHGELSFDPRILFASWQNHPQKGMGLPP